MHNVTYTWIGAVSLLLAGVCHVIWHVPVLSKMSWKDFCVRGGMLILMWTVSASLFASIFGWDSIWRRIGFTVSGVIILIGFVALIWEFRHSPKTAALQPQIGNPASLNPNQKESQ